MTLNKRPRNMGGGSGCKIGIRATLAADPTDLTAPFVYARIMGTGEGPAAGYPPEALDRWAEWARAWAAGKAPDGLETVAPVELGPPRDVFLYVISGHKVANPAAAMEIIGRLG